MSAYLASLLEVGGQRGDELIGGHVLDGSQLDGHLAEAKRKTEMNRVDGIMSTLCARSDCK